MTFAYFMNAYPMTSTTFIRREIEAHERAGYKVKRFAIRPWDQPLVDPKDTHERTITHYLLGQSAVTIPFALIREIVTNPVGLSLGFARTLRLMRAARGKRLKQLAYFLEAVLLKQKTLESGIDHLHTHFSTNSASVALLSHVIGGPGFSMTVHGPDELFEMADNSLTDKVASATFVAAISHYCQQVVDTHTQGAFSDKIRVVRCGLDLDAFEYREDIPDTKTLVCVGRLCKAKAQALLVEALAEVVGPHPDVKLILIGDGEERPLIEETIARLQLGPHVELAGWKQNTDVRAALVQARAMVLPSLAEGLPIVIMESFALGRPVVTTRINGIPELVDATCGWLAEPGDKETLVACLEDLLSKTPEELADMARLGRARVLEMHDQSKSAEELRRLFLNPPC